MMDQYNFPADWKDTRLEEENAIRKVIFYFDKTANDRNAQSAAELVALNGVIVNVQGRRFNGRNEFHSFLKGAMKGALSKLIRKTDIMDIHFIRHDVAVVSAIQVAFTKEGDVQTEHGKGSVTIVLAKEHGTWLIVVGQNTMIGQWE
jgi:uncharacterized protein (TIGR02246 family)